MHHLAERRMRKDGVHQVFLGGLQAHGDYEALDQLGDFGTDHVCTQEFAALSIEDSLYQAVGLTQRNRLAVANKQKAPGLDLAPSILGTVQR